MSSSLTAMLTFTVLACRHCTGSCSSHVCIGDHCDSTKGALEDEMSMLQTRVIGRDWKSSSIVPVPASLTCNSKSTEKNERGNHDETYYLDRHDVACGANELMSQWHLATHGSEFNIDYSCCSAPSQTYGCTAEQTPLSDAGGGDLVYLDRHNVDCGDNKLLSRWHLKRSSDSVQFEYTCCPLPPDAIFGCTDEQTPISASSSSTVYLDRQNVACPANKVMQQFRMVRNGPDIRFSMRCCFVEEAWTLTTTTTPPPFRISPPTSPDAFNPKARRITFSFVGWGQCSDADGKRDHLGWAGEFGNCTIEECASHCADKYECGAFGFFEKHCWLYKKMLPLDGNPRKYVKVNDQFTYYSCYGKDRWLQYCDGGVTIPQFYAINGKSATPKSWQSDGTLRGATPGECLTYCVEQGKSTSKGKKKCTGIRFRVKEHSSEPSTCDISFHENAVSDPKNWLGTPKMYGDTQFKVLGYPYKDWMSFEC